MIRQFRAGRWRLLPCWRLESHGAAREQRPSLVVVRRHPCAAAPRHLDHDLAANGGHPRDGLRPPRTCRGAPSRLRSTEQHTGCQVSFIHELQGRLSHASCIAMGSRQNGRAAWRHLHLSLFSADRGSLRFYALLILLSCTLPLYVTPDPLLFTQKLPSSPCFPAVASAGSKKGSHVHIVMPWPCTHHADCQRHRRLCLAEVFAATNTCCFLVLV